jgi:hypothetical protein
MLIEFFGKTGFEGIAPLLKEAEFTVVETQETAQCLFEEYWLKRACAKPIYIVVLSNA